MAEKIEPFKFSPHAGDVGHTISAPKKNRNENLTTYHFAPSRRTAAQGHHFGRGGSAIASRA
ncbi:MAG TPA: hypothetical protein VJS30_12255 [Paraburkholderia sp.]|nr:hypothetical protein [Paraburkholderia sp.]